MNYCSLLLAKRLFVEMSLWACAQGWRPRQISPWVCSSMTITPYPHGQQECIPVGCVPAVRWTYVGRGVSALGGCLLWGGGVCSWGDLLFGGRVSQHALRQTPLPPWTEWQTGAKILPNEVVASKNRPRHKTLPGPTQNLLKQHPLLQSTVCILIY